MKDADKANKQKNSPGILIMNDEQVSLIFYFTGH
jgi:hypothetical protein